MKLVLSQPCLEPLDRENDLRVLIASEDSAAAAQAYAALECIGHHCGQAGRLIYAWWNFEVLAITSLRTLAGREAAAADLVIIAVHGARELPPEVAAWIASWRDLRKDRREPMIVRLGSNLSDPDYLHGLCSQFRPLAASEPMSCPATASCKNIKPGNDVPVCDAARQFLMTCVKPLNTSFAPNGIRIRG